MAYSEFTLSSVRTSFKLAIIEPPNLFGNISKIPPSSFLLEDLRRKMPFAGGINLEKAKSELIICPILLEVCNVKGPNIGYFSGVEFNVSTTLKLTGYCDFILTKTPSKLEVRTPIVTVVEAKNDNIFLGLGQCAAEMVAAQMRNIEEGVEADILGVVTTGFSWKFLQLKQNDLFIDRAEYFITELNLDQLGNILGILLHPFH